MSIRMLVIYTAKDNSFAVAKGQKFNSIGKAVDVLLDQYPDTRRFNLMTMSPNIEAYWKNNDK